MKALTASALTVLLLALAAQPAQAASIKRQVSDKVLAAYCATVPLNSHTTTTLTGRDGKSVTGAVHCETEDRRMGDDDGHRRGSDDDRWDDDDDDHDDDHGRHGGDDDRDDD